jgi:hypothetical protein
MDWSPNPGSVPLFESICLSTRSSLRPHLWQGALASQDAEQVFQRKLALTPWTNPFPAPQSLWLGLTISTTLAGMHLYVNGMTQAPAGTISSDFAEIYSTYYHDSYSNNEVSFSRGWALCCWHTSSCFPQWLNFYFPLLCFLACLLASTTIQGQGKSFTKSWLSYFLPPPDLSPRAIWLDQV